MLTKIFGLNAESFNKMGTMSQTGYHVQRVGCPQTKIELDFCKSQVNQFGRQVRLGQVSFPPNTFINSTDRLGQVRLASPLMGTLDQLTGKNQNLVLFGCPWERAVRARTQWLESKQGFLQGFNFATTKKSNVHGNLN